MKTTLEFTDEESSEARMALLSGDLHSSLWHAREDLVLLLDNPERAGMMTHFNGEQREAVEKIITGMSETLDMFD